ncbi:6-phosphogluconolactonase [Exilibacterium tricleocarpae]|uniref:6-phosphogluconolactonase n=1 Tax=Exilibacterium tricleocarpae TaxID=2591008 RepID=UPI001C554C6D|nr:6-phosphogluconolactonase [Exilibacterium tricleocarpae]
MTSAVEPAVSLIKHPSTAQFVQSVTAWVADQLQRALAERGKVSLVVSGGRTPAPIFAALAQHHLPWQQVTVLLADERWLPHDHPESNAGLVRQHLLVGPAAAATFIPYPYSGDIAADAASMDRQLGEMEDAFDIVLLGMGDDGHTASLFPCAPELAAGLAGEPARHCLAVHPTSAPHARLSMTLPRLLHSRNIALTLKGDNKLKVYEQALAGSEIPALPVRAVLFQHQVPVTVHWCS